MSAAIEPVLDVRDLRAEYRTTRGTVHAVNGVSFTINAGEVLAVVGESGSGKSATALAVMGLMEHTSGSVVGGQVLFHGTDLLALSEDEVTAVRGNDIAMVFQNPMTTLNPLRTVGSQLVEVLRRHTDLDRSDAQERAVELLSMVEIPEPRSRIRAYPHQLSGGLRQRVMIALALSCDPALLIADEATTALDVTTQAQILKLLKRVTAQTGTAMLVITHSMGVVAGIADHVAVMYTGRVVELGGVREVFYHPRHPYTVGLLGSIPRIDQARDAELTAIPGRPPSLIDLPTGCAFRDRCPLAHERCETDVPALEPADADHVAACWAEPTDVDGLRVGSVPDLEVTR